MVASSQSWLTLAIRGTLLAALGYLAVTFWIGADKFLAAFEQVGTATLLVALAASVANYGLRFARWHMYLHKAGARIGVGTSAAIYLAGFSLTMTPGKAGELVRVLFLQERGTRPAVTMALALSERLSDLVAILIIALPALTLALQGSSTLLAVALGLIVALCLGAVALGVLARRRRDSATLVGKAFSALAGMISTLRTCNTASIACRSLLLSLLAWTFEAYALHLIAAPLGLPDAVLHVMAIYALAMLAGAISFMPGGVGSAEAVMITGLVLLGMPPSGAAAATILSRLTTLWFAVLIGIMALPFARRSTLRDRVDSDCPGKTEMKT